MDCIDPPNVDLVVWSGDLTSLADAQLIDLHAECLDTSPAWTALDTGPYERPRPSCRG
jgi:hypothetical protein